MVLYYHKTGGGAEYYSTTFFETANGHREGTIPGTIMRTDGGELEIFAGRLKEQGIKLVISGADDPAAENSIIANMLKVLDAQLDNCIRAGARFYPARAPYHCISGGNEQQNTFYQGGVNMAEAAVIAAYPGRNACITVDGSRKHQSAIEAGGE